MLPCPLFDPTDFVCAAELLRREKRPEMNKAVAKTLAFLIPVLYSQSEIPVDQRSSAEEKFPASLATISAISSTAWGCASDLAAADMERRRAGSLSNAAIVSTR